VILQELSLKVQMEKNYVNRNAKQARELKDSNEKILALERTLQVHHTLSSYQFPYQCLKLKQAHFNSNKSIQLRSS
jgi:hypothetical protein